jgi:hypothetical protein
MIETAKIEINGNNGFHDWKTWKSRISNPGVNVSIPEGKTIKMIIRNNG